MKMIRPELQRAAPKREPLAALNKAFPTAPQAAASRTGNFGALMSESAANAVTSAATSTAVLAIAPTPQTWSEWVALQAAVAQRLTQLQHAWWQGCGEWLQELSALRRADTLSEFFEQQYNLVAQLGALAKEQTSDLLALQQNVQVDCGYWASRKLKGGS